MQRVDMIMVHYLSHQQPKNELKMIERLVDSLFDVFPSLDSFSALKMHHACCSFFPLRAWHNQSSVVKESDFWALYGGTPTENSLIDDGFISQRLQVK